MLKWVLSKYQPSFSGDLSQAGGLSFLSPLWVSHPSAWLMVHNQWYLLNEAPRKFKGMKFRASESQLLQIGIGWGQCITFKAPLMVLVHAVSSPHFEKTKSNQLAIWGQRLYCVFLLLSICCVPHTLPSPEDGAEPNLLWQVQGPLRVLRWGKCLPWKSPQMEMGDLLTSHCRSQLEAILPSGGPLSMSGNIFARHLGSAIAIL